MNKRIILFFLMTMTSVTFAQKVNISVGINYGNYNMSDMHSLADEIIRRYPVTPKNTRSFPAYIGYEGKFSVAVKRFRIGAAIGWNSTGSRISYADYSGTIAVNQVGRLKQFGFYGEYILSKKSDKWEPYCSMRTAWGRTDYNISEVITLYQQTLVTQSFDFNSSHIIFQPSLGTRRFLAKSCFVDVSISYFIDSADNLHLKDDKEVYMMNEANDPIGVNWSGVRLSIGCGIRL